jgi:branched-chain amino acid transport system ATP-binding protein
MLRVENLCKSFGGVVATSDVTIEFPTGSLSAVIGPNGAGKTTFFNLISGALPPSSGRILLDGVNIVGQSSSDIVRLGIGRAFQVAKLFKTLTVEQSLRGALMSPLGKSLQLHGSFPLSATRGSQRQSIPWGPKIIGYCAGLGAGS